MHDLLFVVVRSQYMRDSKLPQDLRARIRQYITRKWPDHRKFDESNLLHSLPRPLFRDIHIQMLLSLSKSVPLLASASEGFLQSFVPSLRTELVLANETVVFQDEPSSGVYFIGQGECGIYRGIEHVLTLADGSFFGKMLQLYEILSV
jgi:hypothetical protein